jgi:hypothetical protein
MIKQGHGGRYSTLTITFIAQGVAVHVVNHAFFAEDLLFPVLAHLACDA